MVLVPPITGYSGIRWVVEVTDPSNVIRDVLANSIEAVDPNGGRHQWQLISTVPESGDAKTIRAELLLPLQAADNPPNGTWQVEAQGLSDGVGNTLSGVIDTFEVNI